MIIVDCSTSSEKAFDSSVFVSTFKSSLFPKTSITKIDILINEFVTGIRGSYILRTIQKDRFISSML